jgi:hypothetical protein
MAERERWETFRQEYIWCGRANCKCKLEGIGHGPYWYGFQRDENGKLRKRYIGRLLTAENSTPEQRKRAFAAARKRWGGVVYPAGSSTLRKRSLPIDPTVELEGDP